MKVLIASLSAFAILFAAAPSFAAQSDNNGSPTVEKTKKKSKRAANKTKRKARNAANRTDRSSGRL